MPLIAAAASKKCKANLRQYPLPTPNPPDKCVLEKAGHFPSSAQSQFRVLTIFVRFEEKKMKSDLAKFIFINLLVATPIIGICASLFSASELTNFLVFCVWAGAFLSFFTVSRMRKLEVSVSFLMAVLWSFGTIFTAVAMCGIYGALSRIGPCF
jgi:hypothetical protein